MNPSTRFRLSFLLLCALFAMVAQPSAHAQTAELQLRLSRDFGSAFGGSSINGTFSYRVTAPADTVSITYLMDGQPLATSNEPPWRYQFKTGSFAEGVHRMSAVGLAADGRELTSNTLTRNFVAGGDAMRSTIMLLGPILALVAGGMLVSWWLSTRGKTGTEREISGAHGTAVCPTCGKPFARHLWAPNLGAGKFDRCPHCKKWSMVGRATPDQVRDAIILLDDNQPKAAAEESAETLQKRLDNSRYDS